MNLNQKVLSYLGNGGTSSSSTIAYVMGVPEASIRRVIQELRAKGHNISFGPDYRLGN